MKLYGYAEKGDISPLSLSEAVLCATSDELRQMAEFLTSCAAEMDRMGSAYDHVQLSDQIKKFELSPHFVVASLQTDKS